MGYLSKMFMFPLTTCTCICILLYIASFTIHTIYFQFEKKPVNLVNSNRCFVKIKKDFLGWGFKEKYTVYIKTFYEMKKLRRKENARFCFEYCVKLISMSIFAA